ncbi:hypothetical protein HGG75_20885 [Ochrobactrum pseudogrignonense]|nr:hypothetical protein [Brucella pseudogrignonensis]
MQPEIGRLFSSYPLSAERRNNFTITKQFYSFLVKHTLFILNIIAFPAKVRSDFASDIAQEQTVTAVPTIHSELEPL